MRVERLLSVYELKVKYTHFPLHPETPAEGMTLEQLFAGRNIDIPAANARMTQLMSEEGLPYGNRTNTYNSRLAQELAAWAVTQPGGNLIHDALFRAYFVEGLNLAESETLIRVAKQIGLPEAEASHVIGSRQFKGIVDADWQRSRQFGVTGVPTFVTGNRMVVGAQTFEGLSQFVTAAGAMKKQ